MIHSAATVRFDHSLDEARRINVEGTRRDAGLCCGRAPTCAAWPMWARLMWPASAPDLVREDELAVGQSYRNTYEQTKAEAEALVRSRLGSLPGVILRPSIIVGDSRTGVTSSFKMMYWPLKIYARRLWRTVPGYPDAVLDIVPVDYVPLRWRGWPLMRLPGQHGSSLRGTARQRNHPADCARAAEYFNAPEASLCRSEVLFRRDAAAAVSCRLWGRKRRVLRDGRAYRDYFTMRMQFDTTNAERLLGARGVSPAAGARLSRPPFPLLRGQRLGPQAGSRPMNILQPLPALARPQRHRRQSRRRTAAPEGRLRGFG